jgi:hypothetical protein
MLVRALFQRGFGFGFAVRRTTETSDGYGEDVGGIRERFTSVVQVSVGGQEGVLLQIRVCSDSGSGDAHARTPTRRRVTGVVSQPTKPGRQRQADRQFEAQRLRTASQPPIRLRLSCIRARYGVFNRRACSEQVFQREKTLRCASQAVPHVEREPAVRMANFDSWATDWRRPAIITVAAAAAADPLSLSFVAAASRASPGSSWSVVFVMNTPLHVTSVLYCRYAVAQIPPWPAHRPSHAIKPSLPALLLLLTLLHDILPTWPISCCTLFRETLETELPR